MMRVPGAVVGLLLAVLLAAGEPRILDEPDITERQDDALEKLTEGLASLKATVSAIARQTMLQQVFVEERIRSDGDSGVKQTRNMRTGTRPYHTNTHTSANTVMSIHEHANNDRTVGMGEFIAVLNGVEFRTRHNDYRLNMPHRTSKDWHATEPIPFPDVPPAVLAKTNVSEQMVEMRKWFKAWKDQDYSERDYRKYFKPVVCYLEGAWTTEVTGAIDEPFQSDRHFIDASSWFDLQEKVRFTSYTGRKDNLENFSYLPTTIMNITEEGYPKLAQWNYRILCHPISRNIPLNRFRMVDELGPRMTSRRTYEQQRDTRAARFTLNPKDTDQWVDGIINKRWGLLDSIMSEVPGADNYQGNLQDEAFDITAFKMEPGKTKEKLVASQYHRWFGVKVKGAMGTNIRHRGYADNNLFMAMTTQPKVEGMSLETCRRNNKNCKTLTQKWTYAIPLEIIYLTPLSKWNPYDLKYHGESKNTIETTVAANGRNGGKTVESAFDGTHSKRYYQTPASFFSGTEVEKDAADTTKNTVGVLDKKGNLRITKASGTRIFIPDIAGVGTLRQRWPIVPVHGEGSSVWKELEATKDVLLHSTTNSKYLREPLPSGGGTAPVSPPPLQPLTMKMTGPHEHLVEFSAEEVGRLNRDEAVTIYSSQANSHHHLVKVRKVLRKGTIYYRIFKCDRKARNIEDNTVCMDHHKRDLADYP